MVLLGKNEQDQVMSSLARNLHLQRPQSSRFPRVASFSRRGCRVLKGLPVGTNADRRSSKRWFEIWIEPTSEPTQRFCFRFGGCERFCSLSLVLLGCAILELGGEVV